MISSDTIEFLARYFIGDIESGYPRKTASQIYAFFSRYLSSPVRYGDEYPLPSRWQIAYNRIIETINAGRLDDFLTIILSDTFLSKELDSSNASLIEAAKENHLRVINHRLGYDEYKIVRTVDKYRALPINLDEVFLGDGGFASCFYIKSQGVVVKRLKEEFRLNERIKSRFRREYNITKSLFEKGIAGVIKVFDFDENNLSYTMERAEMDLEEFIRSNELSDEMRTRIIFQILDVMAKVHNEGVIHRDLSPKNILLFSGLFKISDFGLGKDIEVLYSHLTASTAGYGTFIYSDPSVVMKLKNGNKLSDIYSLGRIINFIMKGNPLNSEHEFRFVVEKATNQNEAFRYQSVENMLVALRKVLEFNSSLEIAKRMEEAIQREIVSEETHEYVSSFSTEKLFKRLQDTAFCRFYIKMLNSSLETENHIQNTLSNLFDYVINLWHKTFESLDCLCNLGIPLVLGKHDYVTKQLAINLINIPLEANRFHCIRRVRDELAGNIDPSLEEELSIDSGN